MTVLGLTILPLIGILSRLDNHCQNQHYVFVLRHMVTVLRANCPFSRWNLVSFRVSLSKSIPFFGNEKVDPFVLQLSLGDRAQSQLSCLSSESCLVSVPTINVFKLQASSSSSRNTWSTTSNVEDVQFYRGSISTVEDIQCCGVVPSVLWIVFSTFGDVQYCKDVPYYG